jgi:RND family efflux transporter MFP subunit
VDRIQGHDSRALPQDMIMNAFRRSSCVASISIGRAGLAGLALVAACAKPAPIASTATAVKVAVVEQSGTAAGTRYSAQIEPATRVDLAFKVGGYIDSVTQAPGLDGKPRLLQEGDAVRAGMALARLRTTDYQQKLGEAQAAMAQAKVALDQAQMDLDRVSKLADSGAVPVAERDAQKTRRDSAAAQYTGARVRVDEAQTALADTVLRSPLTGVVLKRNIEVGALAGPGLVGFAVADVDSVKAMYGVPDTALSRVRLGAVQTVTTEAYPGTQFSGRISRIAPSADPRSRVFEVEISIPNDDGRLKPGMVAALALEAGADASAKSEPLVPLSAIVRSPSKAGGFAVYVVADAKGHPVAHARDVELGEYLGRVIPVRQGLAGGETIVVQGAGLLSDGEPVQVIP